MARREVTGRGLGLDLIESKGGSPDPEDDDESDDDDQPAADLIDQPHPDPMNRTTMNRMMTNHQTRRASGSRPCSEAADPWTAASLNPERTGPESKGAS